MKDWSRRQLLKSGVALQAAIGAKPEARRSRLIRANLERPRRFASFGNVCCSISGGASILGRCRRKRTSDLVSAAPAVSRRPGTSRSQQPRFR